MRCAATNRFRGAARAWLVLTVAWASAPGASAADECELPSIIEGHVLSTSRYEDFRITLDPPDYGNADAVRRHFVFLSAWGSLLTSELDARSQRGCDVYVELSSFPDLRATLVGYRSARGHRDFFAAVCLPLLHEIVRDWTPDEAALAKAVVELTRWNKFAKGSALSSRSYPFDFTEDMLRSALARIYDETSVLRVLVSVDKESYRIVATGAFAEWIGRQRRGRLDIRPLSLCPAASPRTSTGLPLPLSRKRSPAFPPSTTAPAGAITIPRGEVGGDLPAAFQHVVVIGDDRPATATPYLFYTMSPYAWAVDRKYCGKRHTLDLGDDPARPTSISVSIECQFATILTFDDWMLLFCKDCGSPRAAEAFAKMVIDDPEMRAVKNAETDMKSKGPYLVSFTTSGK